MVLAGFGGGLALAAPANAAVVCAKTAAAPQSSSPSPGHPCWTDVDPYPFGVDGGPVDPSASDCPSYSCYLQVSSMAFRAWNRGLALVGQTATGDSSPYGVWVYNGTIWVPNPSFPGSGQCGGNTILWAGKLDYWVIGAGDGDWPALCRYDGADFAWETVPIPPSALSAVPTDGNGNLDSGGITGGACFAWNDCWFFGTFGVVLHWNGTSLTGQTAGLGVTPWLQADYQAATTGTDPAGQPFAFVVGNQTRGSAATGGTATGGTPALPSAPDGTPGPTVMRSTGGPFSPSPLAPAGTARVAVAFNGNGQGWITGDKSGEVPQLTAISTAGAAVDCPTASGAPIAPSLTWGTGALGVLPDGDAISGGELGSGQAGQPVLAKIPCSGSPTLTEFVGSDPTAADPKTAALVPADEDAGITAVSVSAANDAWASTGEGSVFDPSTSLDDSQPPHLYQYTDGQTPDAPAGNDDEVRTVIEPTTPTLFSTPPPVIVSVAPAPTVTQQVKAKKHKTVHLASPVYAFKFSKASAVGGGRYRLTLSFKVRRPVTLGVDALHGKRVIARSGLHRFRGRSGRLVFLLHRGDWPTGWKVSLAKADK